ncbi:Tetratricopeptide repeat (TPR)-like superfamily protein [Forsythia ovata]|uniref:Tetratricopeptide repeat (TPR)-like superfamily protein n=1 Tax=Forsythia ovata TaxID=205694 RepID=A0ABD1T6M8_9LAMI
MGVKVATACLNWSHPSISHSPSSSQTLASAISSPCIVRRNIISSDGALVCRHVHRLDRSVLFGTHQSSKLYRSRSFENSKSRDQPLRRACSASLASFSDEEFSKKIKELALRFQLSDDEDESSGTHNAMFEAEQGMRSDSIEKRCGNVDVSSDIETKFLEYQSFEPLEPPDFPERDEIIPANIERKANSFEIPLSLRMIKRKKQWQEGFREAGELAYCSVDKAFSSMVFIIQELQSYTLQMREILFYEDLQGILVRVQKEMHASFVWLFQQVFSHTPTLMVYVMILLANYSVYSMGTNAAIAAIPPVHAYATTMETVSVVEDQSRVEQKFDSSAVKTFKLSSSNGKTASIGGGNGGGGKYRPVASGTDGDGRFDESGYHRTIVPDELSSVGNPSRTGEEESVSGQVAREEEVSLWNSIVEEASRMQAAKTGEALDLETRQNLVPPVNAKIEADDYAEYFRTELLYQTGLAREPNNPLLLANYAQFLYLVAQDYDRAEDYFKRAAKVEPKDAEALNKYANFLWQVKKDLWAAEETYLEAITAEPNNSYYAANYAHFLWNTGGEDTCFPLDSPDPSPDV